MNRFEHFEAIVARRLQRHMWRHLLFIPAIQPFEFEILRRLSWIVVKEGRCKQLVTVGRKVPPAALERIIARGQRPALRPFATLLLLYQFADEQVRLREGRTLLQLLSSMAVLIFIFSWSKRVKSRTLSILQTNRAAAELLSVC